MNINAGVDVLLNNNLISETELSQMVGDSPSKIVKFFCGSATWLLSEYDHEANVFFGLCDLGLGCPELGYVSPVELSGLVQGTPRGFVLERDKYFEPTKTLKDYTKDAMRQGSITA